MNEFPGQTGCKARPQAGFCFSGLLGSRELTTVGQLACIGGVVTVLAVKPREPWRFRRPHCNGAMPRRRIDRHKRAFCPAANSLFLERFGVQNNYIVVW
jgi:hypothetical protein